MKAELGKFKKEMDRLEVEVPKEGNAFVGAPVKAANGSGPAHSQLQLRVVSGHSFLNGIPDTIFFDGEMKLEVRFLNRGYSEKLTEERFGKLLEEFRELFPNRYLQHDLPTHTITLGLMTDTETPVDESSKALLGEIADKFHLDKDALLKQANWCLVTR